MRVYRIGPLLVVLVLALSSLRAAGEYVSALPFPSTVCVDVDCGVTASLRADSLRDIASVPLKGWNSYDSWLWRVNETTVLQHIDYVAEHLYQHGYRLVTIDYYWYLDLDEQTTYMDTCGRPQPDPRRFPSSAADQGFKQLATYAHQRGLLFGIHVMRGINEVAIAQQLTVCGSNVSTADIYIEELECNFSFAASRFYTVNTSHPAGQLFVDTLYAQYAEWGVDFVKQDCVLDGDWDYSSIVAASTGIEHSGRQMLLSLSGGGSDDLYHASRVANLSSIYRITNDVWDRWTTSIKAHFQTAHELAGYIEHPNGRYGWPSFPDLDMLPFGFISAENSNLPPYHLSNLTEDELTTAMTLWTMFRSPLVYGGDLTHPDAFSLGLVTNELALRITDASVNNRDLLTTSSLAIWRADSANYSTDGVSYASISNLADEEQRVELSVALLRFPYQQGDSCTALDVWARAEVGEVSAIDVTLPPHASLLWLLNNCTYSAGPVAGEKVVTELTGGATRGQAVRDGRRHARRAELSAAY